MGGQHRHTAGTGSAPRNLPKWLPLPKWQSPFRCRNTPPIVSESIPLPLYPNPFQRKGLGRTPSPCACESRGGTLARRIVWDTMDVPRMGVGRKLALRGAGEGARCPEPLRGAFASNSLPPLGKRAPRNPSGVDFLRNNQPPPTLRGPVQSPPLFTPVEHAPARALGRTPTDKPCT